MYAQLDFEPNTNSFEKYKVSTTLEIKVLQALNERYKQKPEKLLDLSGEANFRSRKQSSRLDTLNMSLNSELTQSRRSTQLYQHAPFDYRGRVRNAIKAKPGHESFETPSMTVFESISTRPTTGVHTLNQLGFNKPNAYGRMPSLDL